MRSRYHGRILTSATLALMLATTSDASAQDSNESAATFNERFPADQTSTQPAVAPPEARNAPHAAKRQARKSRMLQRGIASRAQNARARELSSDRARSSTPEPRCARASANFSITPLRQPMLRWAWSPIPAGASAGTIHRCPARSFPGRELSSVLSSA